MMTLCLPRPVTAKKAHSEWFLYRRTNSTTSVTEPASLGVPSTLRTGIGLERVRVERQFALIYSLSINIPVAPESSRARTDLTSPVSVVTSSTFRVRERRVPSVSSKASMTKWDGSHLSQWGLGVLWISGVTGVIFRVCTTLGISTGPSISDILSTDKTEKQFWLDSGGVLFTCCRGENPHGFWVRAVGADPMELHLAVPASSPTLPATHPMSWSRH